MVRIRTSADKHRESIRQTGRVVRAERKNVKKTVEHATENHGANKRLTVTMETTTEMVETYDVEIINKLKDVQCSAITDSEDVLAFIKSRQPQLRILPHQEVKDADIEDADFDEIIEDAQLELQDSDVKTSHHYLPSKKKRLPLLTPEDKEIEEAYENYKKKPFRKAKELLDKAVPLIPTVTDKQPEYRLVNEEVKDEENYTREYVSSPTYTKEVDFAKFANPEEFEKSINLKGKTLIECIVEYVKTKVIKYPSIKCRYQVLIGYIMMIEEKWDITLMPVVIGNMFWMQFESFLYNNNLSPRTVTNVCLELRAVIKWASLYGASLSVDFDDVEFKAVDCKPKVTLNEDEISRIHWFDLNTIDCREDHRKTLEIVRDHFILSCYLGQRFSDTVRIDETNFLGASKETFRIIQKKTGNKAVLDFNKIFPEYPAHVKKILEKYNYNSPYKGDICNYNRWLHELGRIVGLDEEIKYEYKVNGKIVTKTFKKWELISSHTARRTFITLAVKRSINSQYIKRASGHKSDASFDKYIIFDDDK